VLGISMLPHAVHCAIAVAFGHMFNATHQTPAPVKSVF
jgi:hypothetical protein